MRPQSTLRPQCLTVNSGNRFTDISSEDLTNASASFKNIKELALEETLLSWPEIVTLASHFPDLTTLLASGNQIASLSPIPASSPFLSTLTSLNLEFNELTSLCSLAPLTSLSALRNLHLKGNRISSILSPDLPPTTPPPIFSPTLHYLDLSSNKISSWSFADLLPTCFPGLSSLRFAHNPIYDDPDLDSPVPPSAAEIKPSRGTEESYMLLAARLPQLRAINFSSITPQDRTNAEAFYLSRIARQLASVAEEDEPALLAARHPRYADLCALYGAPAVARAKPGEVELDARFLDGRLVTVSFSFSLTADGVEGGRGGGERKVRLPRSFDLYAVKGVAGRLFGVSPLRVRLVWETGEWDPVGGFDEEVGRDDDDSSEDEEAELERERRGADVSEREGGGGKAAGGGRWVKREVELRDGPRQFGYCVDGSEARIRVEVTG